jgi:hypothetical protein
VSGFVASGQLLFEREQNTPVRREGESSGTVTFFGRENGDIWTVPFSVLLNGRNGNQLLLAHSIAEQQEEKRHFCGSPIHRMNHSTSRV